ncbi:hypothetical protein HMPREF1051_3206 [Neisseria sicca VK64]|uniref:Uncharacterized protein n=1 Tax=Neisseria sicca VK64 TaxID=1095748 RepID=I2NT79_NEISI|nr:hypothetical protein HMPREF1051_3206 [Neisseria sicca VK64]
MNVSDDLCRMTGRLKTVCPTGGAKPECGKAKGFAFGLILLRRQTALRSDG